MQRVPWPRRVGHGPAHVLGRHADCHDLPCVRRYGKDHRPSVPGVRRPRPCARPPARYRGVPVGIRDGQQLRLSGFGEAGMNGAASGDLIVTCRIQPHEFFERDGDNLHARANVSFVQAALERTSRLKAYSKTSRSRSASRGLPERAGRPRARFRHAALQERSSR